MNYNTKPLLLPEQNVRAETPATAMQSGLMARAMLVAVLSLTLVGAMRWALNITNANARQISTNLTHLQGQYEQEPTSAPPRINNVAPKRASVGPTLEPE